MPGYCDQLTIEKPSIMATRRRGRVFYAYELCLKLGRPMTGARFHHRLGSFAASAMSPIGTKRRPIRRPIGPFRGRRRLINVRLFARPVAPDPGCVKTLRV